jgi:hypothetical protein
VSGSLGVFNINHVTPHVIEEEEEYIHALINEGLQLPPPTRRGLIGRRRVCHQVQAARFRPRRVFGINRHARGVARHCGRGRIESRIKQLTNLFHNDKS